MVAYNPLTQIYSFLSPNKIIFGADATANLGKEIESMRLKKARALLISDKTMTKIGLTDKIKIIFEKEKIIVDIFDEIETEPTIKIMMNATETVRSNKYDFVIGLGGGSCMDTAKAAAIMATNEGNIKNYAGKYKVKNKTLPKILIPTTAGTGSEATYALVFSDGHDKKFVFDPKCIAELAVVDPLLMLTLPPKVTATTGMDALSHAIESLLTINSNPLTEAVALQAIYLIFRNIRIAYNHGNNLEARANMAYAATLGGLALNSGGSWAHSFSYTVSSRFGIPHGLGCAIGLPYSMELNLYPKAKNLAKVAQAAGEDIKGLTEIEAAYKAVKAVKRLLEDLHIPLALKDLKIPMNILPDLANELINKYPRPTSPRQLTEKDALELYKKMWAGKIKTEP